MELIKYKCQCEEYTSVAKSYIQSVMNHASAENKTMLNSNYIQKHYRIILSRGLYLYILMISALGCYPEADSLNPTATTSSSLVTILDQREYIVHQQLALINEGSGQPEKENIWIALIRDFP